MLSDIDPSQCFSCWKDACNDHSWMRPESLSCDPSFLGEMLRACAKGLTVVKVRSPVSAPFHSLPGLPLCLSGTGRLSVSK